MSTESDKGATTEAHGAAAIPTVAGSATREIPAIAFVKWGAAANLRRDIAAGLDVNMQDEAGMTALHHAAALGARPCIRVLVASGRCDYLIRDNQGRYASDLAIEWARDYAVARLLTRHQAMQAHERGVPAWQKPEA